VKFSRFWNELLDDALKINKLNAVQFIYCVANSVQASTDVHYWDALL